VPWRGRNLAAYDKGMHRIHTGTEREGEGEGREQEEVGKKRGEGDLKGKREKNDK
jgi:hypothetical protein